MIYKHFLNSEVINSIDINSLNILISQFYPLIYPRYINTFLADDFLIKYRHLSDNLLGLNIKAAGGSTFGSAFGLYVYGHPLISGLLILIFSSINFLILYFVANKIQTILDKTENDYSIRNYVYILTVIPFKSTWGGGLFPSEFIWLLVAYLLMNIFAKFLNKIF